MRCAALTHKNRQCSNQAAPGNVYCKIHIRQKTFVLDKEKNDRAREIWKTLYAEDPLPDICRDMVCGAKTRSGRPCRRRDLYANGRCRLHGGLSTGPKTEQGKKRSCENLPWMKKRKRRESSLNKPRERKNFPNDFENK